MITKEFLIQQENEVKRLWEAGELPWLTHLQGGNESELIEIFKDIKPTDFVLASHRCHYAYTLHGGTDLIEQIKRGHSMFLFSEYFLCSAIVAGVCSIACGIALANQQNGSQQRVFCFCGDGATDEGSFWEAVRFCEGRGLPLKFIVEDNGAQCGVGYEERWGAGNGQLGVELLPYECVEYYSYVPTYPHSGCLGADGKPTRPPIKFPIERNRSTPV